MKRRKRRKTPNSSRLLCLFAAIPSEVGLVHPTDQSVSVSHGDAVPQKFIPKLIRLFRSGRFPFDRLVRFYNFAGINRAIADSKRGQTIKPVLLIGQQTADESS